ncbi:MAG: hypothetical protein O3B01_10630 [Planctomycetota bacterium]|nr:hypothetical protein [Planctomycetota bacterium]MDA1139026.1 hypothetical protein [Planctomycetota bacterium]
MPAQPVFSNRAIFLASQSKNSYEQMPTVEAVQLLHEMAHWGYNEYWFQFDRIQFEDIFNHRTEEESGRTEWQKQKEVAAMAKRLGMKTAFVSPANICYRNQGDKASQSKQESNGEFGIVQEQVCPSKPRGKEIILRNFRNLFQDLPELDTLCLRAYGDGGCRCKDCRPWVRTFIELTQEIARVLHEFHEHAELLVLDWRFNEKEVAAVAQYIRQEEPTWIHGIVKSDRNPPGHWSKHELPIQYRQVALLDISKLGGWANFGANPFPRRTQALVAELAENNFNSLVVSSDELHDDLNKVFVSQFASEPDASLLEICKRYASRYFGSNNGEAIYEVVQLLEAGWTPRAGVWFNQEFSSQPEDNDDVARLLGDCLKDAGPQASMNWRWKMISHRLKIGQLIQQIGTMDDLTREVESLIKLTKKMDTRIELVDLINRIRGMLSERSDLLEKLESEINNMRTQTLGLDEKRWPRLDVTSNIFEGRWGQTWAAWQRTIWRLEVWLDGCCNERTPQGIKNSLIEIPKLQSGKTSLIIAKPHS